MTGKGFEPFNPVIIFESFVQKQGKGVKIGLMAKEIEELVSKFTEILTHNYSFNNRLFIVPWY